MRGFAKPPVGTYIPGWGGFASGNTNTTGFPWKLRGRDASATRLGCSARRRPAARRCRRLGHGSGRADGSWRGWHLSRRGIPSRRGTSRAGVVDRDVKKLALEERRNVEDRDPDRDDALA